jgi:hypothetical protein
MPVIISTTAAEIAGAFTVRSRQVIELAPQ